MEHLRITFVLTTLLTTSVFGVQARDCSNHGVLIDIHNRQVAGRPNIVRYGLSVNLGTPSQTDSIWPALTHNETTFAAPDYCPDDDQICLDGTRGYFNKSASSTWIDVKDYSVSDSKDRFADYNITIGQDTLDIWQTKVYGGQQTRLPIEQFPAMIMSNYNRMSNYTPLYGPAGVLGLGPSSTILSRLMESGLIAARSFGLYLGPDFLKTGDARSGSLVLGGYDAGRFVEPVALFPQIRPAEPHLLSPFRITVLNVSLITSGGETVLPLSDEAFDAVISTESIPLQFPQSVTRRFQSFLQARVDNTQNTLALPGPWEGNMTIQLKDNVNITFDSAWMTDNSNITPISAEPLNNDTFANSTHKGAPPIVFGAAFLARAYLFANYESSPPSFGLAQALPEVEFIEQRPYCPDTIPTAKPVGDIPVQSKSRTALIAGLCGGLVGGFAMLALLWFCYGARFRRSLRSNDPRYALDDDSYLQRPSVKGRFHYWKNKTWKSVASSQSRTHQYVYNNLMTSQKPVPHVSAFAFPSSEKLGSIRSIDDSPPLEYRNSSQSDLTRERQRSIEKDLKMLYYEQPSSSHSKDYANYTSRFADPSYNPSHLRSMSGSNVSATPLSNYNRHQRGGSSSKNSVQSMPGAHSFATETSRTLFSPELIEVRENGSEPKPAYEKSLPATPGRYTPHSMFPHAEAQPVTSTVPRIPSLALTSTNLGAPSPASTVPPRMPTISAGLALGSFKPRGRNRARQETEQAERSPTLASSGVYEPIDNLTTPTSASTISSFWKNMPRPLNVVKNSGKGKVTGNVSASRPKLETRSSSARSRHAMAARLSRFREFQHIGVKEVTIGKRNRSKSRERQPPVPQVPTAANLRVPAGPVTPNHRRRPSARDISPCVSAPDSDRFGSVIETEGSDYVVSPVSSAGGGITRVVKGAKGWAKTPPLPKVPADYRGANVL